MGPTSRVVEAILGAHQIGWKVMQVFLIHPSLPWSESGSGTVACRLLNTQLERLLESVLRGGWSVEDAHTHH